MVSIILPFHNRIATLPRCVESVRAQTWTDWELIAVDDGSSDGSASVFAAYADARIKVLRHEMNLGAGPARDTAMRVGRGEYFALIDSDDEWFPGKLAAQLETLRRERSRLSSTAFHFVRGGQSVVWPKPFRTGAWEKTLHRECTFGFGTTLLIEREAALGLNGFDQSLPRHEDWDWVLRAFEAGHALSFIPQPMARVFATGSVSLEQFIPSTHRFLAKHDDALRKFGGKYRREVIAHHFETIASLAYEQRRYGLGHRYILRATAVRPWRNPMALAALPVGSLDWLLGTRFLQKGAALVRSRRAGEPPWQTIE
ncbi:MAG TPA: glycosyltransferase family 2 protein [Chthoniobacteraceae bacterium]|nr:glycosyltransferase family 2 protein [Chthoniobacteraceae bacterium]